MHKCNMRCIRCKNERLYVSTDKKECLRSQFVTLNEKRGQHLKYYPYAFTELGVAMLSSVLRSETAIEVKNKF